jgi:hypothetical protein
MSKVLPKKVKVKTLIAGRYNGQEKPLSWDDRVGGIDVILDENGTEFQLQSTGDQSPPREGWQIMLTDSGDMANTYKWTLYGLVS